MSRSRLSVVATVLSLAVVACGDAFSLAPLDGGADVATTDATNPHPGDDGAPPTTDAGHPADATMNPPDATSGDGGGGGGGADAEADASIDAPVIAADASDGAVVGVDAATCKCPLCQSCALPGHVGTCTNLPDGVDDIAGFCTGQATCSGGGCVAAGGKGHVGDACMSNGDCFNGTCAQGLCKLPNGDACADHAACASGLCSANVCRVCVQGADCPSLFCTSGACLLPGGYVCAAGADCASGSCAATKRCIQSGSVCGPASCFTHFCGTNNTCQTCSQAADCPGGTPCTGGSCLAPPGAYCTADSDCASGTCLAAPPVGAQRCK